MIRLYICILLAMIISGCEFDLSPWETDVDCPNLSVEENLAWLKTIEAQHSASDTYKVAVIGDPQQFPGDLEDTIKTINAMDDVHFILLLGDVVETGIEKEYEWACTALNQTEKPIISVIGNHDALSYGKQIWLKVFGEFDFSFHYLGSKYIGYNDNQYEFHDAPDKDWLAAQGALAENETRLHTIGMSHIEPWGNAPGLSAFLKDNGYTHMLHAHRHKFDYFQEQDVGLPHFVTADTQDVKFAVMTVSPESITMEQCDPVCLDATIRTQL